MKLTACHGFSVVLLLMIKSSANAKGNFTYHVPFLRGSQDGLQDQKQVEGRTLFGGEDFLTGPFHHEDITHEALIESGFSEIAADNISWHADYVDSYAYNPLYWLDVYDLETETVSIDLDTLRLQRFKAARSIFPDLVKVHFDDLNLPEQVVTAYYRYMTGCLTGLYWAAEMDAGSYTEGIDPIGAAHNLLGVAFHALQDFFAHSNWIDEGYRRDKTPFDFPRCELRNTFLYTGYFETDGIKPHGKFSVICSLTGDNLLGNAISLALDAYCSIPFYSQEEICLEYRDCENLEPLAANGAFIGGFSIPENVLYYAPPGINLDTNWSAEVGVIVREIDDELSGNEAFNIAKGLAKDASIRFVDLIENVMIQEGYQSFWEKVKIQVSPEPKEYPFEKFNRFPFQFITAGPYPDVGLNDDGYYLRIVLKTSNDFGSGTDADIKAIASDKTFDLDYMPGASPLIGYNDFEAGDQDVYTVGPFPSFPSELKLQNDAPDFVDILKKLGESLIALFIELGEAIRDFFINNADYVGTNTFVMEPRFLNNIGVGTSKDEKVHINGGSEGRYDIHFRIERVSGNKFRVTILRLHCIEESDVDSGTWADEPFLFTRLDSYPGGRQSKQSGPFGDVDSGDTRHINHSFNDIVFEGPLGAIVLGFRIWESDWETAGDRNELMNEFLGEAEPETQGFFETVGEAIAADWKIDWIKVYAFHRGDSIKTGQVLYNTVDRWIEGGESYTYSLNIAGLRTRRGINFKPTAVCQPVVKVTDEKCETEVTPKEFDGGSTDPECDELTFSALPSSPYPGLVTYSVTITARDVADNIDTCVTTISFEDKMPPDMTGCTSTTVECSAIEGTPREDSQLSPFFDIVDVSDNCDANPTLTNDAPNFFPVQQTSVTFTATDDSGNTADCMKHVTVVDTTPPAITGCSDVTIECSSIGGSPNKGRFLRPFFKNVEAPDICDPDPALFHDSPNFFPVHETTTVKFTAEDKYGNSASCFGSVTVQDTTPPAVSMSTSTITLWPPDNKFYKFDLIKDFDVTTDDICSGTANTLLSITSISSDEPDKSNARKPSSVIRDNTSFKVRAQRLDKDELDDEDEDEDDSNRRLLRRLGKSKKNSSSSKKSDDDKDGRTYTIDFDAIDSNGQVSKMQVYVNVPLKKPKGFSKGSWKSSSSKSSSSSKKSSSSKSSSSSIII